MTERAEKSSEVITAFLWDGQRVLLALRSATVSTFPNCWAGISGYLEGDDPRAWALVEIEQETGLRRGQLLLRRVGEPLLAEGAVGRQFLVHPLLFSVLPPLDLRADWEAVQLEWVELDELRAGRRQPLVPQLAEAFARVWPPWSLEPTWKANLELSRRWLREDREHGAGSLARAAAAEIAKLLTLLDAAEWDAQRPRVVAAIDALRAVRPTMAPLENLLAEIRERVASAPSPAALRAEIDARVKRSEAAEVEVARRLAALLPAGARVMTISYSSTVGRALELAGQTLAGVVICEGRPELEGRRLARQLAERGLLVTLITDAQMLALLPEIDLVVFGADAVLPDGAVLNKMGSGLLALTAQHAGKPVLVAADALKRVRTTPALEENPSAEVWPDAPANVTVANRYFERVPAAWITQLVTEAQDA